MSKPLSKAKMKKVAERAVRHSVAVLLDNEKTCDRIRENAISRMSLAVNSKDDIQWDRAQTAVHKAFDKIVEMLNRDDDPPMNY